MDTKSQELLSRAAVHIGQLTMELMVADQERGELRKEIAELKAANAAYIDKKKKKDDPS